ncbi:AAA family ATPase [Acidithiobacillus ferrivorans]|uniref:AAA family ATPase n=1 Tax=Acidithiobacillus ferrivorans TaxID=160808 RepID=UPI001C06A73F|nr:ATP-binding protein [Acidithiobacillus ferrivorans]MBU2849720.1 AAA family ATPase [Acidithiobacillus ferrivorans]
MHLQSLRVINFRALKNIEVVFDNKVNVIVGPNAIGKSTILEAIRLAKAMLAPRTQNESNQVLFSLGAASPHIPTRLRMSAIAQDETQPTIISCVYKLIDSEIALLRNEIPQIAKSMVQARMGQAFAFPGALISFLSSEQGRSEVDKAREEIEEGITRINDNNSQVRIELTITPGVGPSSTGDQIGPFLLSYIEQKNPPNKTMFTYFPADRALPSGEQPVQLGSADSAQQLESHNSQPQLKYARLKNAIFSAVITNGDSQENPMEELTRIFEGLLRGRKIKNVGINELGLLSIIVEDENGHQFDIDGMSSGEKGLILTFYLVERTVSDGGIVLLDEPELHLNPAVSKDLLSFIVDKYAIRKSLQFIICSHSPEILAGAFDKDECSLYSLISGNVLTKVRRQDQDVISNALRELGASEVDELLFDGIIFVEGVDDIFLLEAGYGDLLKRKKLKDLGGRSGVEHKIKELQSTENGEAPNSMRYFIFDKDDVPSSLMNSTWVKVLQWDRRCLENYLLDIDVLTDLLMDGNITSTPKGNMAEVNAYLKGLAFSQIPERAAREVYLRYQFDNVGLRSGEIKGLNLERISEILAGRLGKMRAQLDALQMDSWESSFKTACEDKVRNLKQVWEIKWQEECDGKRLFQDISKDIKLKMSIRELKKRVMIHMRNKQSENWMLVKSLLINLIDRQCKL